VETPAHDAVMPEKYNTKLQENKSQIHANWLFCFLSTCLENGNIRNNRQEGKI